MSNTAQYCVNVSIWSFWQIFFYPFLKKKKSQSLGKVVDSAAMVQRAVVRRIPNIMGFLKILLRPIFFRGGSAGAV